MKKTTLLLLVLGSISILLTGCKNRHLSLYEIAYMSEGNSSKGSGSSNNGTNNNGGSSSNGSSNNNSSDYSDLGSGFVKSSSETIDNMVREDKKLLEQHNFSVFIYDYELTLKSEEKDLGATEGTMLHYLTSFTELDENDEQEQIKIWYFKTSSIAKSCRAATEDGYKTVGCRLIRGDTNNLFK